MEGSGDLPARPMSIKEISDKASDYEWNPNIEFKYWVRAADTIYREVSRPVPACSPVWCVGAGC